LLPAPVKEKGSKGFFPFLLILVDKNSGLVMGPLMLSPEPDLHSMYESIPSKLVEELLKTGHRPSKIEIRSSLLYELLKDTMEDAGCTVAWAKEMPRMDEVIGGMITHMT
jgi:hypothetical protein